MIMCIQTEVKAILTTKCAEGVEMDSKESSWKSELVIEECTEA